jgi:hypothetical protein
MDKEKIIKLFNDELSMIHNSSMRDLVIMILADRVNNDYFFIPASMTSKYHPAICNLKHGLLVHIKLSCAYCKVLIDALIDEGKQKQQDLIITACLLHDISKKGKYDKYNDYKNHPLIASLLVQSYIEENIILLNEIEKQEQNELTNLIKFHSGIFTPSEFKKPITHYSTNELIIYLADYMSSRKNQNHEPYILNRHKLISEILA